MSSILLQDRRIMIVEDEYLIALDLCQLLESFGAAVLGPHASLKGAMSALDEEPAVDAAVLDINLRGEVVYPLAEALAERRIPFVFTTGYDSEGLPERYRSIPRCEKPARIGAIVELIERQIAAPAYLPSNTVRPPYSPARDRSSEMNSWKSGPPTRPSSTRA